MTKNNWLGTMDRFFSIKKQFFQTILVNYKQKQKHSQAKINNWLLDR